MGINTDFLKRRLGQLQSKRNVQSHIWKPTSGDTKIRIVPYKHNRENPFIELYWHYGFNNKNWVSPISIDQSDPIMEFAEKLKATGESDDWKSGKQLEPKLRTYVPVIVRGEEDEGVKFWGFGIKIYEQLLTLIADPEWGDITHPSTGHDINVKFQTAKELGKDYPETSIRVSPKPSTLTSDVKTAKKLLNDQPKITEVYTIPTYDELKKELNKFLHGDEEVEEVKAPVKAKKEGVDEIDEIADSTDEDLETVMDDFDNLIDD